MSRPFGLVLTPATPIEAPATHSNARVAYCYAGYGAEEARMTAQPAPPAPFLLHVVSHVQPGKFV